MFTLTVALGVCKGVFLIGLGITAIVEALNQIPI